MGRSTTRAKAVLCLALILALTGCRRGADIHPAAADIARISSAAGFLAVSVEESEGFIASSETEAADYAYVYDNAVALIALCGVGADGHAQKIADAMVFAQGHDRTFDDGRLRNAYISGNPKSDSGRSITNREVTIRLPGFWQDGRWQEDSYTVSTSTGNMAWAILALCTAAESAPAEKRTEYLDAAVRAADFVLTLQGDGHGFTAGYEGWDEAQIKVTYKSTEHNVALVRAFSALSDAVAETDKSAAYHAAAESAQDFVLSMYDPKLHCFYTGTDYDGQTTSKGVIPLDASALSILALPGEIADVYAVLAFVEERMSVGDGFDFSAGDLDGIWNEGTAQMAVCYNLTGAGEKYERTMQYLKTQAARDGSIPAADRDGVSTGFVVVGSDALWEYHNAQSIAATAWYAFAQAKINPLQNIAE